MTATALTRLLTMDRRQAAFRLRGEARKWRERIGLTCSTPGWRRSHLIEEMRELRDAPDWNLARAEIRRGNFHAAHKALARHFTERESAFPLDPRDLSRVSASVAAAFPGAAGDASRRAGDITQGYYELLGHRRTNVGFPVDWHRDAVHGRRMPDGHWASVPYLDPAYGDHKVIWELNRHQHWLTLGRAFALTGNTAYYDTFRAQLRGWLDQNPPLTGVNWASMLELALRTISWLWAVSFFAAAARQDADSHEAWLVDALLAIAEQTAHVERNLSLYFSPNTHLTGEALGLYVTGCALPELESSDRWSAVGREILLHEAEAQVSSDGGHVERSGHYHRYSTDFYLLALVVARRHGDAAAARFEEAARVQAGFLRTIADDSGQRPAIGDDDGGQLFPVCGRPAEDCRDTLSIAAVLLDQPELALGPAPEEAYWLCGEHAASRLTIDEPAAWPSAALPGTGYYVSRTAAGDHLIFDAGPHGFLNGGHAHADALALVLTVGGRPLLIDPGTATYTMDRDVRDAFRGTAMHNTLVLDERPQSEPQGPFHWRTRALATAGLWRSTAGCDYVEGSHHGYLPTRHTRSVLACHDVGWLILDSVSGGGTHDASILWHLHPAWNPTIRNGPVDLRHLDGTELALASTWPIRFLAPGESPLAVWSPAYGRVEPAPVLISRRRIESPQIVATFVSARPATGLAIEPLTLARVPAGWRSAGWRVSWSGGSLTVLAALEPEGMPDSDLASPAVRWGTKTFQTDARLAALLEVNGRQEGTLVNGRIIWRDGRELLRLPDPAPIVRTPVRPDVALSVHEETDEVGIH